MRFTRKPDLIREAADRGVEIYESALSNGLCEAERKYGRQLTSSEKHILQIGLVHGMRAISEIMPG